MGTQVRASVGVKGTKDSWEGRGPLEQATVKASLAPLTPAGVGELRRARAHGERRHYPRQVLTALRERTHVLLPKTLRSEQAEPRRCRERRPGCEGSTREPADPAGSRGEAGGAGPTTSLLCAKCLPLLFCINHASPPIIRGQAPHPPRPLLHLLRQSQQQSEGGGWQV